MSVAPETFSKLSTTWIQLWAPLPHKIESIWKNYIDEITKNIKSSDPNFSGKNYEEASLYAFSFGRRFDCLILTASDFLSEVVKMQYIEGIRNTTVNFSLPIIYQQRKYHPLIESNGKVTGISSPKEMINVIKESGYLFISILYLKCLNSNESNNYNKENEFINKITQLIEEFEKNNTILAYLFSNLGREEIQIVCASNEFGVIGKLSYRLRTELGINVMTIPCVNIQAIKKAEGKFPSEDDNIFPIIKIRVIPGTEALVQKYLNKEIIKLIPINKFQTYHTLGKNDLTVIFIDGCNSDVLIKLFFGEFCNTRNYNLFDKINSEIKNYIKIKSPNIDINLIDNVILSTETSLQFQHKIEDDKAVIEEKAIKESLDNNGRSKIEIELIKISTIARSRNGWTLNSKETFLNIINLVRMISEDKRNTSFFLPMMYSIKSLYENIDYIEKMKRKMLEIENTTCKDSTDHKIIDVKFVDFKKETGKWMNELDKQLNLLFSRYNEIIDFRINQVHTLSSIVDSNLFHKGNIVRYIFWWEILCQKGINNLKEFNPNDKVKMMPYFILLNITNSFDTVCYPFHNIGFVHASSKRILDIRLAYHHVLHDSTENFIHSIFTLFRDEEKQIKLDSIVNKNEKSMKTEIGKQNPWSLSKKYSLEEETKNMLLGSIKFRPFVSNIEFRNIFEKEIEFSFEGIIDALAYLSNKYILGKTPKISSFIYWYSVYRYYDRKNHEMLEMENENIKIKDSESMFISAIQNYFIRRVTFRYFTDIKILEKFSKEDSFDNIINCTLNFGNVIKEEFNYLVDFIKKQEIKEKRRRLLLAITVFCGFDRKDKTIKPNQIFEQFYNKLIDYLNQNDKIRGKKKVHYLISLAFYQEFTKCFNIDQWIKNLIDNDREENIWEKIDYEICSVEMNDHAFKEDDFRAFWTRDSINYIRSYQEFIHLAQQTNLEKLYKF